MKRTRPGENFFTWAQDNPDGGLRWIVETKPIRLGWLRRPYWQLTIYAPDRKLLGVTQSRRDQADAERMVQDYLKLIEYQ